MKETKHKGLFSVYLHLHKVWKQATKIEHLRIYTVVLKAKEKLGSSAINNS